jgi:hypothetical protein
MDLSAQCNGFEGRLDPNLDPNLDPIRNLKVQVDPARSGSLN